MLEIGKIMLSLNINYSKDNSNKKLANLMMIQKNQFLIINWKTEIKY